MLRILRIFMLRILRILSICLFKKVRSWRVNVKVRRMLQYMELWHTITGLTNSISRKRETEIPPHMWASTGYYPVTLERRGLRPALVFPPRFVFVRFCIVSAPPLYWVQTANDAQRTKFLLQIFKYHSCQVFVRNVN